MKKNKDISTALFKRFKNLSEDSKEKLNRYVNKYQNIDVKQLIDLFEVYDIYQIYQR